MGPYDLLKTVLLVLSVYIIQGSYILVEAQTTSFSYLPFVSRDDFLTANDVQYYEYGNSFLLNSGAYSLGPPTSTCGRLYYQDKVRMKDASGAMASFSTNFTFSITGSDATSHADGLAFTFSRNISSEGWEAKGEGGGTICLMEPGSNHTKFFAVEFDTFLNDNYGDPSGNHIGVDVDSLNSTFVHDLDTDGYELFNSGPFTAWIDYDSPSQNLAVYFSPGIMYDNNLALKPSEPVIHITLNLTNQLEDYMYVGFCAGIGSLKEVHQIRAWQFATYGLLEETSSIKGKVLIIAGICVGVGAVLMVAGIVIAKRRKRASQPKEGTKIILVDLPRAFTYEELSKATKNFSRSEILGSGGFGVVYKGVLSCGALVAVKRMRHESKLGEEGFQAEADSLSKIRHRNLVQLRGWCHVEGERLLVYDFMCNGGLDEWLFQFPERKGKAPSLHHLRLAESLPLLLRHSILSGVAAALAYLHEGCKQCVLHRDIKSSNVLLDEDLNAYLGDFGLSRFIAHQKMELTTPMAGTRGYVAPEMPVTGKATKESDVYSFGVLMLEVMCGVPPLVDMSATERGCSGALVDRMWHALETGNILQLVDPKLGRFPPTDADPYAGTERRQEASSLLVSVDVEMVDVIPGSGRYTSNNTAMEEQKMVTNLLHLGLLCCHPNPEDRPSMRLVSQWLQTNSESMEKLLPPLPKCKPQAWYKQPAPATSWNSDDVRDAAAGQTSF